MKNLLIIYPHWPPSNLAGIHRPRLIGNYLHEFGWQAHVVTVKPEFYEEKPDNDIVKTVHSSIKVYYTNAKKPPKKLRLIGDIALRALPNLYKEALKIIKEQPIDFIWIPIPSFYTAILGRLLHTKTKIPYGIDYIDPWVNGFVDFDKAFSRAWLSNQLAKILEPFSLKKASLITGVSTSYYQGVLDRNFKNKNIEHIGMPYGFDPNDHQVILNNIQRPWKKEKNAKIFVYAGAFLPKSHLFLELMFQSIKELRKEKRWDENIRFYFLGTGSYKAKSIQAYAEENQIDDIVTENRSRFPFLHILNYLSASDGVLVIGSTEKHYTASKIFQALLSQKPVFPIFHYESSAVNILSESNADNYLSKYKPEEKTDALKLRIKENLFNFAFGNLNWNPKFDNLDNYSAKASAKALVEKLNKITKKE